MIWWSVGYTNKKPYQTLWSNYGELGGYAPPAMGKATYYECFPQRLYLTERSIPVNRKVIEWRDPDG